MRIIIFFDLPNVTAKDHREYYKFRKFLIKSGYIMEQESVYSKLAANGVVADNLIKNIDNNKPEKGTIQVLKITETQYANTTFILGNKKKNVLNSSERLIII